MKLGSVTLPLIAMVAVLLTGTSALATPQVTVTGGTIQGTSANGIDVFKGVPFAAPPVGPLRWRAPQSVIPWSGIYDASRDKPDCMQLKFPSKVAPLGDVGLSEDCLYLNVWRPAGAKHLPVMVWIHGGGFVNGGISPKTFDGKYFAHKGVVLVSLNYRLGRFGFFAHPALAKENPDEPKGNYGYMDQIAALKWVKANIANFGGDPDNITVFGESAGGGSVHTLLTSPLAQGLFHKAIIQSGGGRSPLMGNRRLSGDQPDLPSLETVGINFARANSISGANEAALAKLRSLPAEKLVGDLSMLKMDAQTYGGPSIDGKLVVEPPQSAYEAGRQAKVPLMIGATNADLGTLNATSLDDAFAPFGDSGDDARKAYDPECTDNLKLIVSRMGADMMMVEPARFTAREFSKQGLPIYEFRFSYVAQMDAASQKSDPGSKNIVNTGARHATDVPYAFDTISSVLGDQATPRDAAMAYTVSTYWANFAKTGNPNSGDLPPWPVYDARSDVLMNFTSDGSAKAMADPWKVRLDLMEGRITGK